MKNQSRGHRIGNPVLVDGTLLDAEVRQKLGKERLNSEAIVDRIVGGRVAVRWPGDAEVFWLEHNDVMRLETSSAA